MPWSARFLLMISILLISSRGTSFAIEPANDVLIQDSFEEGTDAPNGWKQGSDVRGVKYIYDRESGSDGKRSLSLQKSEKRFFPIAHWHRSFKHAGGKSSLKVTAKVKAEKAAKAIIDVQFLDANDQEIKHEWVSYIGQKEQTDPLATHDWKIYEGTVDIPKGTAQIVIAFQIYGPGKVWFDELEARYVDKVAATNEPNHHPVVPLIDEKARIGNPAVSAEGKPNRSDAEMHVVGIYGPKNSETKRVDVEVRPTPKPVVLVLSAYYSTRWQINLAKGARIESVIIGGYFEQEVAGLPDNVPIVNRSYSHADGSRRKEDSFNAYRWNTFDYRRMLETLNEMTGLLVATFQSKYEGVSFVVDGSKGCQLAQTERRVKQKPVAEPTSEEMLAVCANAELHVVSIYSAPHDGKNGDEISVNVPPTKKPIVLALASYSSVLWNVKIQPGATVKAIIIGGYYEQEFQGIPAGIPLIVRTYFPDQNRDYFYGHETNSPTYLKMEHRLKELTGLPIVSIQSQSQGTSFNVDGANTVESNRKNSKSESDPLADVADVLSQELKADGDPDKRYFLIGPRPETQPPGDGRGLVLVIPGGDGSAAFHPFVRRIFKHALPDGYVIAQPVAIKWTPEQQIVWPTKLRPADRMKFSTEDFLEAVVADVSRKHKLNRKKVFSLSWSSSGPAAYAASLTENSSITGSFIAMSVFYPENLPPLDQAKGRDYYLYHSRDDRICKFPRQSRQRHA